MKVQEKRFTRKEAMGRLQRKCAFCPDAWRTGVVCPVGQGKPYVGARYPENRCVEECHDVFRSYDLSERQTR